MSNRKVLIKNKEYTIIHKTPEEVVGDSLLGESVGYTDPYKKEIVIRKELKETESERFEFIEKYEIIRAFVIECGLTESTYLPMTDVINFFAKNFDEIKKAID